MLAGSHTLGGHFLFKPLTILNMKENPNNYGILPAKVRYSTAISDFEKILFIELTALADETGFAYASNRYLAERFNKSESTISRCISNLEVARFIHREVVRNEKKEIVQRKLYPLCDYLGRDLSLNLNIPILKNEDTPIRKNDKVNKGSIEIKEEEIKDTPILKIHDQVNKTKVVVHDEVKPNKQLQFVSEVVAYLNQKTNQQFKTTTKETIQFINSRVKLDGWELEDFKAVIDFKTNEWLKDDKMRQYLCPSTLFRASNAEKYLLAAKASKPKPPVQKQYPTKVHVEQPVNIQPVSFDAKQLFGV